MATITNENVETNMSETKELKFKKTVITNQEITSNKWRFDSLFKLLAGIIYGFFFGLIPGTYYFSTGISSENVPLREIAATVSFLLVGILSIILIFWSFKGDIKKQYPFSYSIIHFINSIGLCVGLLICTIFYNNVNDVQRYFIFAITSLGWALVMIIAIGIFLGVNRRKFPLSWSKFLLATFTFIFMGIINLFIYLGSEAILEKSLSDQANIFYILALVSFILALLVFGFGIAFIKRYRDVLLGERTEYEISSIRDWESSRIMAIIMASSMIITYACALIINKLSLDTFKFQIPLIIEIAIDALLLIVYMFVVLKIKIQNLKSPNKNLHIFKIFKPIDNGLLLDIFGWIILAKAVLLQGIYVTNVAELNPVSKSLLLIISAGSLIILYGFTAIASINVPNLRNTAITIPTIAFTIVSGIFAILFASYLQFADDLDNLIYIWLPLFLLVGISISLIIKVFMVARIFKSNWRKPEMIDKTYMVKEQQEQAEEDLIGERTKEVNVEELRKEAQDLNIAMEEINK